MRVETTAIANAPPPEVWRWWTDYGEPGTETRVSHGIGRSRRRVLEADGDHVVLLDQLPLPKGARAPMVRHEVTLHPAERRIHETGHEPLRFESDWTFEPTSDGAATRVRRVLTVDHRALDAVRALAEPVARRIAARDLAHHVRDLERDLGR